MERRNVWRAITFLHGILVSTCGGTLYAYSAYANTLKTRLGWSQSATNLVSSVGDNGLYVAGIPLSVLLDKAGPSPVLALSAALGAGGYAIMAACAAGSLPSSPAVMGVGFFLVGLASSGGYSSALATNVVNFAPARRGSVVGVIVAGFGLSAFLVSQLYGAAFAGSGNVSAFFVVMAIVLGCVFAVGVGLLRQIPYIHDLVDEPSGSRGRFGQVDPSPEGYASYASAPARIERAGAGTAASESSPLLLGSAAGAQQGIEGIEIVGGTAAGDESPAELPDGLHGIYLATSLEYWLLYGTLVCGLGCGLMYINNLSSVMVSVAQGKLDKSTLSSKTSLMVGVLSIANCVGRAAFGVTADAVVPWLGVPHASFLVLAMGLMTMAQALNAFVFLSLDALWITTIATGLAYGGLFAIGPTCVARFSLAYFATNWCITGTSAGVGGNALNTVFGAIYDAHTPSGMDKCFGHDCYAPAFVVSFVTALVGLTASIILAVKRGASPIPLDPDTKPLINH